MAEVKVDMACGIHAQVSERGVYLTRLDRYRVFDGPEEYKVVKHEIYLTVHEVRTLVKLLEAVQQ